MTVTELLGFDAARRVVKIGRSAFFPTADADLPRNRSPEQAWHDRVPQLGYVGERYHETRVLLLGINPGNGGTGKAADAIMIPVLRRFAQAPTEENFIDASRAYQAGFEDWGIGMLRCPQLFGPPGKLDYSEVAYTNCLPWRTESRPPFCDDVIRRAATHYVHHLIEALEPALIVAMGKDDVPVFLDMTGLSLPLVIPWNRSRAATPAALSEREATAGRIFRFVESRRRHFHG